MKVHVDINQEYTEISVVVQAPQMDKAVVDIVDRLNLEEQKLLPISGKMDDKIYILSPHEVYSFYSQNGKVYAATKDKTVEVKQPLYQIEETVKNASFTRISQSVLVNIRKIENIEVSFNGSLVVKLKNEQKEVISRRFVTQFKRFIGLGGKK